MNNKFPSEKLAGLDTLKLEVGEPSAESFSSDWVPWLEWGEHLQKKGTCYYLPCALGHLASSCLSEVIPFKLQGSPSSLLKEFFPLELILFFWHLHLSDIYF